MNFVACIEEAVSSGRVTHEKARSAKEEYEKQLEALLASGMKESDAKLQAAIAATERLTNVVKDKRWEKLNVIQRSYEIAQKLKKEPDTVKAIDDIMRDLELSYDTVTAFATSYISKLLVKYRPKGAGTIRPKGGLDEIARAAYGESKDSVAIQYAKAIQDMLEDLRIWANQYGANIPENPNYKLFQTHDPIRVSSYTRDEWVEDHLREGVLDWENMRYAGREIDPADRRKVLEAVYDGIVSDGYDDPKTAQLHSVNLASRLNRDRFLYYKSGDAWLEMQGKYGAGDLHQQLIAMIDAMAKDISTLMHFGPSPGSMFEYFRRTALKIASDKDRAIGANQRKILNKVRRRVDIAKEELQVHMHHTPTLESNFAIQSFTSLRTLAVSAILGGITIANAVSDPLFSVFAKSLHNVPAVKVFRNYLSQLIPNEKNMEEMINAGVIFDHGMSIAANRIRYFSMMDAPAAARNYSEFVYRFSLTSHETQIARNAAGKGFLDALYRHKDMKFEDLPFREFFEEHNITKEDWDAMRSIPVYEFKSGKFLRPIDLHRAGNIEAAAKFGNAMQQFIRTSVPNTSLRASVTLAAADNPNKVFTQIAKSMGSLMSFPLTVFFTHMRMIARAQNRLELAAKYFVLMTIGGMVITNAKMMASGYKPYLGFDEEGNFNPLDRRGLDFLGRSMVNGASLGILGDILFDIIDISNSGYKRGNPTEEYINSFIRLTVGNLNKALDPEKETTVKKDLLNFAQKNIPEFWHTKLIVRRYIMDEVQRQADPKGYIRKKKYEQKAITDPFWPMGEELEF